jgi:carbamate kinase
MGLEVIAADTFIEHTGRVAVIGSIAATSALLRSDAPL